jgi:hypothetical protein
LHQFVSQGLAVKTVEFCGCAHGVEIAFQQFNALKTIPDPVILSRLSTIPTSCSMRLRLTPITATNCAM